MAFRVSPDATAIVVGGQPRKVKASLKVAPTRGEGVQHAADGGVYASQYRQ